MNSGRIRRRLLLRAAVDRALERYLTARTSSHGDAAGEARAVFLDTVIARFDELPETIAMAEAMVILSRQLAGRPGTSRQLREALGDVISILEDR